MPRHPVTLPPSVFPLAQETDRPLRWRLHQGLRQAILNGQFPPGSRLPSSRALASSFGVSRATVVEAFDQLAAEGFIERRAGSGTYVSQLLGTIRPQRAGEDIQHRKPARRVIPHANRSTRHSRPIPFTPCEPDITRFPHQLWAKLLARHAREPSDEQLGAGRPRLRAALAASLSLSRGVTADPAQVIVVGGALQALHLATQVLLNPGDRVWFEDPGYVAARNVLELAGTRIVPVPVDHDGIDVTEGRRLAPRARAAFVAPSHQFPTSAQMSLGRRLDLLDWAAREQAWVFEDDWDSEFCYDNRPLPALQGLDEHHSVIYLGSLNKITYPGFRVGYLVAPPGTVAAFETTMATLSLCPPVVVQEALADFIDEGHLARHIHRMRMLYKQRQDLIVAELRRSLGDAITVTARTVGMDVLVTVHELLATDVASECQASGLDVCPLANYAIDATPDNAVHLGYTHLTPDMITAAVGEFAGIVRRMSTGTPSSRRRRT